MDDQALIQTYGNTDLPEGTPDRPVVTFAIFTYNHENYIREALAGALSQTYTPLEIIVSDDASHDQTFSVIKSVVENYSGSHQIRIIKYQTNNGTVNHLIRTARVAKGKLLVLAAGDDISYSSRTQKIVDAWLKERPSCINSKFDEIDHLNSLLAEGQKWGWCRDTQRIFRTSDTAIKYNGLVANVVGFSAAYPTDFWAKMPLTSRRLLVEDGLATCIINASGGKIITINDALLAYRIHDKSMSIRHGTEDKEELALRENRIERSAQDIVDRIDYILELESRGELAISDIDRKNLLKERRYGEIILNFWSESRFNRIARLAKARNLREVKFIVPRIFGLSWFYLTRNLASIHIKLSQDANSRNNAE